MQKHVMLLVAAILAHGITADARPGRTQPAEKVEVSQESLKVSQANNAFALDLYQRLAKEEGNLFCSPYSIHQAFSLAWAGARGDTAGQMASTLNVNDLKADDVHAGSAALIRRLNAQDKPYQLSVANAMWLQQKYHFLEDYLRLGARRYGAELRELDFAGAAEPSRQTINRWVEQQTANRIKDLLPAGTIDGLTRLVLTNAIYFKGNWSEQFDKKLTKEQPFHITAGDKVQVPLMYRKDKFGYAEHADLQVLELPYEGDDLTMVVLLPKAVDGLPALEKRLTDQAFKLWLKPARRQDVRVFLPRFKLESSFSLNQTMQALGMEDAFDGQKADFSGITGSPELYITDAVHKAFVEVNEEGTEAAAATGIAIGVTSLPPPPKVFRADHPFLFLIRDNPSGAILFLGRVTSP